MLVDGSVFKDNTGLPPFQVYGPEDATESGIADLHSSICLELVC